MKLLVAQLSDRDIARIAEAVPEVQIDRAADAEEAKAKIATADIYLPGPRSPELFENAEILNWVHCMWAGMDHSPFLSALSEKVIVTNSAGVFSVPIAEHVMALILAFTRGIDICTRWPKEKLWGQGNYWERINPYLFELEGATLGVIGYGGIGQATAQRATAFGMRVIAQRRNPEKQSKFADETVGPDKLDYLLAESDYILVSCPMNDETAGLLGAREFGLMKKTAVIVNVARGGVIDEPALIEALKTGQIRGAGLDVTTIEPLPFDSPLWTMENVIITPHIAGSGPSTWRRQIDFFLVNLKRYVNCEPLLNVIDRKLKY